ncbi:hypothetical protein CL659_03765 [bacterium]|nr:hypothetical protein [bacterium]
MFRKVFSILILFCFFSFLLHSYETAPGKGTNKSIDVLIGLNDAFIGISEKVNPSIVYIQVGEEVEVQQGSQNPFGGWPFDLPFPMPEQNQSQQFWREGSGSGFIVSDDGFILTNDHVVGTADEINVTMFNGDVYPAKLIGGDPSTDVALIKIDADFDLPHLKMDLKNEPKVGQWVLAFGNPLQLRFTVTSGIISAMSRNLGILRNSSTWAIEDFIQTDAAINPGNSGGPLVNLYGEVIGINSALVSDTGNFAGYGFAIPIKLAKRVMDDLIEFGEVRRAVMGVMVAPIQDLDREALNLPEDFGVLISGFVPSDEGWSPSEEAGLKQLDVIWAIDDRKVRNPSSLQKIISSYEPGDVVVLQVYRDGELSEFSVTLGTAPKPKQEIIVADSKQEQDILLVIGIEAGDFVAEDLTAAGWPNPPKKGIIINSIIRGSSAQKRGLVNFVGYIITHIGEYEIENLNMAIETLNQFEAGTIVYFNIIGPDGYSTPISIRIP